MSSSRLLVLPDDLLHECLTHLDPGALRKAKCVCSWLQVVGTYIANSVAYKAKHYSLEDLLCARPSEAGAAATLERIRLNPSEALKCNGEGLLPLHHACRYWGGSPAIVEALLQANPCAVTLRGDIHTNREGLLPLHMLVRTTSADYTTVKRLIGLHSEACMLEDDEGKLPLHSAIRTLRSAGARNEDRWLAILQMVFEAFPAAAEHRDKGGRLPLHWACASDIPADFVQALIAQFATAPTVKDSAGWLPLHYAVKQLAPEGTIKTLICKHPGALWSRTERGPGEAQLIPNEFREAICSATLQSAYRLAEDCLADRLEQLTPKEETAPTITTWKDTPLRPWTWGVSYPGDRLRGLLTNVVVHLFSAGMTVVMVQQFLQLCKLLVHAYGLIFGIDEAYKDVLNDVL